MSRPSKSHCVSRAVSKGRMVKLCLSSTADAEPTAEALKQAAQILTEKISVLAYFYYSKLIYITLTSFKMTKIMRAFKAGFSALKYQNQIISLLSTELLTEDGYKNVLNISTWDVTMFGCRK